MDAAETPRRRRRAARRKAGPPAQASTSPIAELADDPESAGLADGAEVGAPTTRQSGRNTGADAAERDPTAQVAPSLDPTGQEPAGLEPTPGAGRGRDARRSSTGTADERLQPAAPSVPEDSVAAAAPDVFHGSPADAPAGPSHTPAPHRDRSDRPSGTTTPTGEPPRRSGRSSREEASERSLRSLVTTRSTQVSTSAALRAREVALPSAADLAAAEENLVVVRRHYVPPTVLATGRRPDRTGRRPSGQDG